MGSTKLGKLMNFYLERMQVKILHFKLAWDGGEFFGKSKCLSKLVLSFGNFSIIVFLLSLIFMLECHFARACWHGSYLALHTSELTNLTVQQWLKFLLSSDIQNGSDSMIFLQDVFVFLWTIWTYKNRVVHPGLNPNPVNVILIAQNFSCRYKNSISRCSTSTNRERRSTRSEGLSATRDWQLIIKIAGARSKRPCRLGIAYEALTIQGERVFFGVNSSNARTLWLKLV